MVICNKNVIVQNIWNIPRMRLNVEIILKVKLYSLSIGNSDYPHTVDILGVVWWIVRRRDVSWWISIIKLKETTTSWKQTSGFTLIIFIISIHYQINLKLLEYSRYHLKYSPELWASNTNLKPFASLEPSETKWAYRLLSVVWNVDGALAPQRRPDRVGELPSGPFRN